MEFSKTILFSIYIGLGLYFLYKLLFRKNPYQEEYERLYKEILTSRKHRVKGQFDKDE